MAGAPRVSLPLRNEYEPLFPFHGGSAEEATSYRPSISSGCVQFAQRKSTRRRANCADGSACGGDHALDESTVRRLLCSKCSPRGCGLSGEGASRTRFDSSGGIILS